VSTRPGYLVLVGLRGARGFAAGFGAGLGAVLGAGLAATTGGGAAFGTSPSRVLTGQMRKAGHFWQPATMAIGHMVMEIPLDDCKVPSQYGGGRWPEVVGFA
jgi:hypothetical protein